jgi:hypothetical protein
MNQIDSSKGFPQTYVSMATGWNFESGPYSGGKVIGKGKCPS